MGEFSRGRGKERGVRPASGSLPEGRKGRGLTQGLWK